MSLIWSGRILLVVNLKTNRLAIVSAKLACLRAKQVILRSDETK